MIGESNSHALLQVEITSVPCRKTERLLTKILIFRLDVTITNQITPCRAFQELVAIKVCLRALNSGKLSLLGTGYLQIDSL